MLDQLERETTDETLKKILNELYIIKKDIEDLKKKINMMHDSNQSIKESSDKMANHIDFVENVYDRIRKPFNFLLNTMSRSNIELEDVKNTKTELD